MRSLICDFCTVRMKAIIEISQITRCLPILEKKILMGKISIVQVIIIISNNAKESCKFERSIGKVCTSVRIDIPDRIVFAERVQVRAALLLDRVASSPPPDIRAIVTEC